MCTLAPLLPSFLSSSESRKIHPAEREAEEGRKKFLIPGGGGEGRTKGNTHQTDRNKRDYAQFAKLAS